MKNNINKIMEILVDVVDNGYVEIISADYNWFISFKYRGKDYNFSDSKFYEAVWLIELWLEEMDLLKKYDNC